MFDVTLAFEGTSIKVVVVLHSCRYSIPIDVSLNLGNQVRGSFLRLAARLSSRSQLLTACVMLNPPLIIAAAVLRYYDATLRTFFIPSIRILADLLGFSGALGIQLIVSSLQEEVTSINFFVLPRIM